MTEQQLREAFEAGARWVAQADDPARSKISMDRGFAEFVKEAAMCTAPQQETTDRYKRAMENHLCEHDMADWLGCSMNHIDACTVCQHDKGTEHTWLARAERAEALLAALPVPEDDPQTEEGDLIKEAERVARVMRENTKDLDPDVKAILYKNLSDFYL